MDPPLLSHQAPFTAIRSADTGAIRRMLVEADASGSNWHSLPHRQRSGSPCSKSRRRPVRSRSSASSSLSTTSRSPQSGPALNSMPSMSPPCKGTLDVVNCKGRGCTSDNNADGQASCYCYATG